MTVTSPRFRWVSASGLVTSTLKCCCVSLNFVAFMYQKILLCFGKCQEISLRSEKDFCVPESIVVFSKRFCFLKKIVVFQNRN